MPHTAFCRLPLRNENDLATLFSEFVCLEVLEVVHLPSSQPLLKGKSRAVSRPLDLVVQMPEFLTK
jgi:hypothetical protein